MSLWLWLGKQHITSNVSTAGPKRIHARCGLWTIDLEANTCIGLPHTQTHTRTNKKGNIPNAGSSDED